MTYFLFSFLFMLMYGGCVAVLAYKAGKCGRDKLVKAKNKKDNFIYFYRSSIDYVLLDKTAPNLVLIKIKGENFLAPLDKNPWVSDFIAEVSK